MRFIKDILLFQMITTGTNPERDSILQLSAVLLDKDNLIEKNFFNSFVKVSFLENTISQHASTLKVDFTVIKNSPKLLEVINNFDEKFSSEPLLATHTVNNVQFLKQAYKKCSKPWNFHSHTLDIWSLGYIYTLHYGLKKMPTMDTLFDHFNLKLENPNNALERTRLSAEVFRKIIKG